MLCVEQMKPWEFSCQRRQSSSCRQDSSAVWNMSLGFHLLARWQANFVPLSKDQYNFNPKRYCRAWYRVGAQISVQWSRKECTLPYLWNSSVTALPWTPGAPEASLRLSAVEHVLWARTFISTPGATVLFKSLTTSVDLNSCSKS